MSNHFFFWRYPPTGLARRGNLEYNVQKREGGAGKWSIPTTMTTAIPMNMTMPNSMSMASPIPTAMSTKIRKR